MENYTPLKQLVYGYLLSKVVVLGDEITDRPFDAFKQIVAHVRSGAPEPDYIYLDDSQSWSEVLQSIESEGFLDLQFIRDVLGMAKEGICLSAIDATLDSDMNQLDMQAMVEKGLLSQTDSGDC